MFILAMALASISPQIDSDDYTFTISPTMSVRVRGTAFLKRFRRYDEPFFYLSWIDGGSLGSLKSLQGASLPAEFQASFRCAYKKNGYLEKCTLENIQPPDERVTEAAMKVVSLLRIFGRGRNQRAKVEYITVAVMLTNSTGYRGANACIPDFCVIHYLPPPPAR